PLPPPPSCAASLFYTYPRCMCHDMIAGEFRRPLEMDVVTHGRIRPSMAKVRVEMDLLTPLIHNVWVGSEDDDSPINGYEQ
ncbi:hypothetical protein HAX54_006832, partial [Datura stramonium]|nr:hypothetical protein [Datura stramonium]